MTGGGRTGWRIAEQDLVRLRRLLGLPRLPQHECTCGKCFAWVPADEWCNGHRLDVLDELAQLEERAASHSTSAQQLCEKGDLMDYDENVVAMLEHGRAPSRAETSHAVRHCKSCGCTDLDCSGCIQRTGFPCFWITEKLCSACASLETLLELSLALVRAGTPLEPISQLTALCAAATRPSTPGSRERLHAPALVNAPALVPAIWEPIPEPPPRKDEPAWDAEPRPRPRLLRVVKVSPELHAFLEARPGGVATENEMPHELRSELGWEAAAPRQMLLPVDDSPCRITQAWIEVAKAIRTVGVYGTPAFPDDIAAAVQAVGWRDLCMASREDATLLFGAAYKKVLEQRAAAGHSPERRTLRSPIRLRNLPALREQLWSKIDDYVVIASGSPAQRGSLIARSGVEHVVDAVIDAAITRARVLGEYLMTVGNQWRVLAELIGEPELGLEPEVLVARLVERFNVLEASKLPDEPELGALMRAAAGVPRVIVTALRELAEALEAVLGPEHRPGRHQRLQGAYAALTRVISTSVWESMRDHTLKRIVDEPDKVAVVLSFAGRMVAVETIATWTSEQRRVALEWAIGRQSTVPEFLAESTGDA